MEEEFDKLRTVKCPKGHKVMVRDHARGFYRCGICKKRYPFKDKPVTPVYS